MLPLVPAPVGTRIPRSWFGFAAAGERRLLRGPGGGVGLGLARGWDGKPRAQGGCAPEREGGQVPLDCPRSTAAHGDVPHEHRIGPDVSESLAHRREQGLVFRCESCAGEMGDHAAAPCSGATN
ncbi:hypothetical protein [Synechococcus phage Yong-M3-232]|nr:hypothetical protein [Synechococcus phage Yong-M3-232]